MKKFIIFYSLFVFLIFNSQGYAQTFLKGSNPLFKERFKNKIVFITGGTSGIGLATAVEFAQQGAEKVIVCGRTEAKWHTAQKYIQSYLTQEESKHIEYWPCDVRVESSMKNTIEKIYKQYGRLDVAFNNAGVSPGHSESIEHLDFDSFVNEQGDIIYRLSAPQPGSKNQNQAWKKEDPTQASSISPYRESEFATNVFGVFYSMKWELVMALQKQPKNLPLSIINTASKFGILPEPYRPLYDASKAYVIALSRSLANQMAARSIQDGRAMIRINVVAPGTTDTPLIASNKTQEGFEKRASAGTPMQRIARPEEIAPSVLFLADNTMSSFITGVVLPVDGGYTGSPLIAPASGPVEGPSKGK